jgi:hypothetical protein
MDRMVYRKGELIPKLIDLHWPHQVALPSELLVGESYVRVHLFCEGLSLCPRGHSFRRDDTDFTVFCFADREHAEEFRARFGGELVDPRTRPRWPKV